MQWLIARGSVAFMSVKVSLPIILGSLSWNARNRPLKWVTRLLIIAILAYAPEKQTLIEINGCVETDLSHDQWLDEFIGWIESRGEYFGGEVEQRSTRIGFAVGPCHFCGSVNPH
ncbi:hypothetical protein CEB3_c40750 [Peptococcaceae bacterium CEB3]|nr:hypothetical protein CEB3_c40750 [Peptococcaceae bacterium CEB3]